MRDNTQPLQGAISCSYIHPTGYLYPHALALVVLVLLAVLRRRRGDGALTSLRESHVAIWSQLILVAQRLEALERPRMAAPARDYDSGDFVYPASPEIRHG